MELLSKKTGLNSSLKAHDEDLSKRKIITSSIRVEINTISSSPMISETDTVILQKLTELLETKPKELEKHSRSMLIISHALEFFCFGNTNLLTLCWNTYFM